MEKKEEKEEKKKKEKKKEKIPHMCESISYCPKWEQFIPQWNSIFLITG